MAPAIEAYHQNKTINTDDWSQVKFKIDRRGQHLNTKAFRSLVLEMLKNLYIHSTSKEDIKHEIEMRSEAEFLDKVQKQRDANKQSINTNSVLDKEKDEPMNHREITYLRDLKKSVNFTFMQALALISAYVAGMNKESMDMKLFERSGTKSRA